jgi:hypothetical protein
MKITKDTSSYNKRRYGKPWIAKIKLEGNDLKFHFGSWVGDPGSEGVLILDDMEPGDFYARGQKDFRNSRYSAPDYYEMDVNGIGTLKTKAEIYKSLASK